MTKENKLLLPLKAKTIDELVINRINLAVNSDDESYIRMLSEFNRCNKLISPSTIVMVFKKPEDMQILFKWLDSEFGEYITICSFQLIATKTLVPSEILRIQSQYVQKIGVRKVDIIKPIKKEQMIDDDNVDAYGALRLHGKSISGLLDQMQKHLLRIAKENCKNENLNAKDLINYYLTSKVQSPVVTSKHIDAIAIDNNGESNLNQEFLQKLNSTTASIKNRFSIEQNSITTDQKIYLQHALNEAYLDKDLMHIAACAMLMIENGITIKATKRIERLTNGTLIPNNTKAKRSERKPQLYDSSEYISISELATRINYSTSTIRYKFIGNTFIEGVHYIRPFGRKILCKWSAIQSLMKSGV
jgi:hypothetical protein